MHLMIATGLGMVIYVILLFHSSNVFYEPKVYFKKVLFLWETVIGGCGEIFLKMFIYGPALCNEAPVAHS